MNIDVTLEDAWKWVNKEFPFADYIPAERKKCYFEMPKAVYKQLKPPADILDFGAGPCDKTAMLAKAGYNITAFDDLGDDWYNFENNREKILQFAEKAGINYILPEPDFDLSFGEKKYDAIILNNVLEHLHDSPKVLLNKLIVCLKDDGLIFIDVPNAANLRKRIHLLMGKTNYASFDSFYWSSYPWRGHVREYVRSDLTKLASFLGLEVVDLSAHHYHLEQLGPLGRVLFQAFCKIANGCRESWLLVARKKAGWKPRVTPNDAEAASAFQKQYFKYDKEMVDWEK